MRADFKNQVEFYQAFKARFSGFHRLDLDFILSLRYKLMTVNIRDVGRDLSQTILTFYSH